MTSILMTTPNTITNAAREAGQNLGKYRANFRSGDVSGVVAITSGGKINLRWDYVPQVDSNYHTLLRDIYLAAPLKELEMDHTLDDAEAVRVAILEVVFAAAKDGVDFGGNADAARIILSEEKEYAWTRLIAQRRAH